MSQTINKLMFLGFGRQPGENIKKCVFRIFMIYIIMGLMLFSDYDFCFFRKFPGTFFNIPSTLTTTHQITKISNNFHKW